MAIQDMNIIITDHGLAVDIRVALAHGLHARPSARISQTARTFVSDIRIASEDGEVDAKSMLDILSLAISHNEQIRLVAAGPDAQDALKTLFPLFTAHED